MIDDREISTGIFGWLESPALGDIVFDFVTVNGWAFSRTVPIQGIDVRRADGTTTVLRHGIVRTDVAAVYPAEVHAHASGFTGFVQFDDADAKPRHLEVWATLNDGREVRLFRRRLNYARGLVSSRSSLDAALRAALVNVRARPSRLLSPAAWSAGMAQLKAALSSPAAPAAPLLARDALTSAYANELQAFLSSGAVIRVRRTATPVMSVVLVLWNRAELWFQCLRALLESDCALQIIAVDNGSADDTATLLTRTENLPVVRNPENLGFTIAANQGAKLATADLLLFLNSDARPLPGGLAALVETIANEPGIGAVGGKLVFPDGTLQEAGAIVWADGACESYGRGDNPASHEFCFERDVDFCSGAFLLTRRDAFERLQGFDEEYQPAYYEDVDYCVRLWRHGLRVVYQPRAVAMHFEFGSAASREHSVQLQVARRGLFARKHRDWLRGQYERSEGTLRARHHRPPQRRTALVIDDKWPDPRNGAGFPRALALLKTLGILGYDVTLYCTSEAKRSGEIETGPVEVVTGQGPAGLRLFLEARRGFYSAVIVSRPHNMGYVKAAAGSDLAFIDAAVIYDAEAIAAVREVGFRRVMGRAVSDEEATHLIQNETSLARGCAAILTVTATDQRHFDAARIEPTFVVGHAVVARPTVTPFGDRAGLLFIGGFGAESPNEDSVRVLVDDILPALDRMNSGGFTLTVAGSNIPERLRRLARPGLLFLSDVDDLTELYERSRLFVAPTRYAAGIPIKLLDAAAHGLPIVCSDLLAEQVGWHDGRELLAAADSAGFAAATARVYSDEALWNALRAGALKRVVTEFNPDNFREALGGALNTVLSPRQ